MNLQIRIKLHFCNVNGTKSKSEAYFKRERSGPSAGQVCQSLLLRHCTFCSCLKKLPSDFPGWKALLILAINLLLSSPLIQHMTVAKMSVYKRMKLACCFDCGRSEHDCSCMSGSVHSNMDSLQRAFPLSSVSVHDCSTSLRACKFDRQTTCRSMSMTCECACVSVPCFMCCVFRSSIISVYVAYGWYTSTYSFLFGELVVVEVTWLLCVSAAVGAVGLC